MPVDVSLISSFSVNGLRKAIEFWPTSVCQNCDLYAFMWQDLLDFFPVRSSSTGDGILFGQRVHRLTAVQAMALAFEEHQENIVQGKNSPIQEIAFRLADAFSKKEITIRAIASYIPELTSRSVLCDHDEPVYPERTLGVNALRFLTILAGYLQGHKHPVSTIEFVAGSRFSGLGRGKSIETNEPVIVAPLVRPLASLDDGEISGLNSPLVKLLLTLAGDIAHDADDKKVRLALELEPGPLNLVNHRNDLVRIANFLDHPPFSDPARRQTLTALTNVFGFNADLAHFELAHMSSPSDVPPSVFKMIRHCHVSEHSLAAFADLPVSKRRHGGIRAWISKLSESVDSNSSDYTFDGFCSVEMEAAPSSLAVEKSVRILQSLIR